MGRSRPLCIFRRAKCASTKPPAHSTSSVELATRPMTAPVNNSMAPGSRAHSAFLSMFPTAVAASSTSLAAIVVAAGGSAVLRRSSIVRPASAW